eukprot:1120705-Prorocentrum_minimum.AAC.1
MHLPCESIGDTRGYRDVVTLIKPESDEAVERLTNHKIQQIAWGLRLAICWILWFVSLGRLRLYKCNYIPVTTGVAYAFAWQ